MSEMSVGLHRSGDGLACWEMVMECLLQSLSFLIPSS